MSILLVAEPNCRLENLASTLRKLGLNCQSHYLDGSHAEFPLSFSNLFLLAPQGGLSSIGEQLSSLASLPVSSDVPVTVCTVILTSHDRRTLRELGAKRFVTPSSWNDGAVTDRILAELVFERQIQPCQFGPLYGASPNMRRVYHEIEVLSPTSEPVLVVGETGVGKELVAQEIHRRSGRSGKFQAINVAELDRDLFGSELFGHEKGAYTGADSKRDGLIVGAQAGTVFLDEIGELRRDLQAKLLRLLDSKTLRPVGADKWVEIKARFVFATNIDLESAVAERRFRADLLERIRGFTISVPPLRERRCDLIMLAHHFLEEYNLEYTGTRSIPQGAMDLLFNHEWPGNVRELRQAIRKAAAFSPEEGSISCASLREATRRHSAIEHRRVIHYDPKFDTWKDVRERLKRSYFEALLESFGNNKAEAARQAGLSRAQLYAILREMDQQD